MLCGYEEAETAQSSSAMKAQFNFFFLHFGEDRQLLLLWQQENSIPASSQQKGDKEQSPKFDEAGSEGSKAWMGEGLSFMSFPICALNPGRGRKRRDFPPSPPSCCKASPGNPHKQGMSLKTFKQLSHQAQESKSQLPKDCHEASH